MQTLKRILIIGGSFFSICILIAVKEGFSDNFFKMLIISAFTIWYGTRSLAIKFIEVYTIGLSTKAEVKMTHPL
jgi:hypothetical protein